MRAQLQAFGGFLTAMVIPCMGAFIAWGFITALFIPTGWIPSEEFAELVDPMITYLLPLLIAYNGGRLVAGDRGAIIGTIGTFGLIVGSDIAMFLGAMIMGPLSAYIIKKFDKAIEGKVKAGFEMIVNNFSVGIIGLILCLVSYSLIGPTIESANAFVLELITDFVALGFLPLLAIVNEPAKVLFLNNVIDQGMYYPLGMQDAVETGKSIYFMVASNPGAGLGLLLAFSMFGKGMAKKSAPGSIIIHFLGGIHEIYFPYVLMKPIMILAMIAGSATGILVFSTMKVGLVAGPSPGSIFSYLALTPKGNYLGVILGVAAATAVSFIIASFFLKISKDTYEDIETSAEKSKAMKAEGKNLLNSALNQGIIEKKYEYIAFVCDAGLGSSALGANMFGKKLIAQGIEIQVKNYAIENVPAEVDVIVVHSNLYERTKKANPNVEIVTIENYLNDENLNKLLECIVRSDN
ncbi:PTS mannitol transporter subunit IIBC [Candidatus Epulonipiscium fishelsonii]|uniref:PTS mannitol transporter subunit IIBC n=1 Tax=Candidatus Epulonipiscium fishelsonii TaxID=77094 RepID=A0ACC8X8N5_9FIRM|nr:PTS mannitol transporter subunit IIBC [Epulopiscium sp. SCG-B11WGA-EpuloA1]ONI38969.1 PTS mannitol transporter subunit IIBC [Epulopiscium sp. SCG-B05WGA-EpuloA1]